MSRTLLHLDSSILGASSASRLLSSHVVDQLSQKLPAVRVTYRDLAAQPIPHLSGPYVAATRGNLAMPLDATLRDDLALGEAVLQEFLAADIVVIGVAFYNFSIASQLKAWIDRIAVAGRTFRYTQSGAEGLSGNKHVFLAIARGGVYGAGSPRHAMEHAETYLRSAFSFIGITQLDVVSAEGLNMGDAAHRSVTIAQAQARIDQTVAALQA